MKTSHCNEINSDETHISTTMFNSFEQCNNELYKINNLSLETYCSFTHQIKFEMELYELIHETKSQWLRSVLDIMIQNAKYDMHSFPIPVYDLVSIGVDLKLYSSRIPESIQNIFKTYDDDMKRQLRFLKKCKLRENIDYIIMDGDIIEVPIGYFISRPALYRIISYLYGSTFLESVVSRMCQVIYYYNDYRQVNQMRCIETLEQKLSELRDTQEHAACTTPKILQLDTYNSCPDYFMDEHLSSSEEHKSSGCSNDNLDETILETNNIKMKYRKIRESDEVIINDMREESKSDMLRYIHTNIENSIHRVDTRISEMYNYLEGITTKIDTIILSINDDIDVRNDKRIESKDDNSLSSESLYIIDNSSESDSDLSIFKSRSSEVDNYRDRYVRSFIGRPPVDHIMSNMRNTHI